MERLDAGSGRSCRQTRLQLLGGFSLVVAGRPMSVGAGGQRLLALLSLRDRVLTRRQAAGLLWTDVASERANANLRSVLWRLQRCGATVLDASFSDLRLAPQLAIDLYEVVTIARRLIDHTSAMGAVQLSEALRSNLQDDLLPEMDDEDWLAAERARHRQLRLHALEMLSERLIEIGWYGAAVDTGLVAVRADPFRESAHHTLIRAYLAEGNQYDAHQQFRAYRRVLRAELGLEPSAQIARLLEPTAGLQRAGRSAA